MELTQEHLDHLANVEEAASLAVREAKRILSVAEHRHSAAQLTLLEYRRRMDIAERTRLAAAARREGAQPQA